LTEQVWVDNKNVKFNAANLKDYKGSPRLLLIDDASQSCELILSLPCAEIVLQPTLAEESLTDQHILINLK
jgi:hypothetical protein